MSKNIKESNNMKQIEHLRQDENKSIISRTEIGKFSENKLTSNLNRKSIVSTYCSSTTTSYSFTKVSKSSHQSVTVDRFLGEEENHENSQPRIRHIQWSHSRDNEFDDFGEEKSHYVEEIPFNIKSNHNETENDGLTNKDDRKHRNNLHIVDEDEKEDDDHFPKFENRPVKSISNFLEKYNRPNEESDNEYGRDMQQLQPQGMDDKILANHEEGKNFCVEEIPLERECTPREIEENDALGKVTREPENAFFNGTLDRKDNDENLQIPKDEEKDSKIVEQQTEHNSELDIKCEENMVQPKSDVPNETISYPDSQYCKDILRLPTEEIEMIMECHSDKYIGDSDISIQSTLGSSNPSISILDDEIRENNVDEDVDHISKFQLIEYSGKEELKQLATLEKTDSISRQSSFDEGRQNALLFVIFLTFVAMLIQALYNLSSWS